VRGAFYDVYGASPTAQLRRFALLEVRRALFEGSAARDAVTRIATDYGFGHLSRFAGQYRAAFGESPSATVRRAK
jgi:AraC family ethanolamine operon transcriptional activator